LYGARVPERMTTMWNRADLKMKGKAAFTANYWYCVLVALILSIVNSIMQFNSSTTSIRNSFSSMTQSAGQNYSNYSDAFNSILKQYQASGFTMAALSLSSLAILATIFLINVLFVGGCRFFVDNRVGQGTLEKLGIGFKDGAYGNVVLTMFLKDLFTVLWTLLFIIPGIIKSYEYRMIPYILAENPKMTHKEAFAISKKMMMGNKLDTFVLDLSFLGWVILSGLTCGILGIFFVNPYYEATIAELYSALVQKGYDEGFLGRD
jgi:uncharacterized membrane protein